MPCRACAAPITPEDRFCPMCGEPLPGDPGPRTVDIDVEELTRLRRAKERVSGELHAILEQAQERDLTSEERRDWSNRYAHWRELTYRITKIMDTLSPRAPDDRRSSGPHMVPQLPGHAAPERRRGHDRRDPFWDRVP